MRKQNFLEVRESCIDRTANAQLTGLGELAECLLCKKSADLSNAAEAFCQAVDRCIPTANLHFLVRRDQ